METEPKQKPSWKKLKATYTSMQESITLINGDNVQGWVKNMRKILNGLDPLVDNIPDVWNRFCNEFGEQFLNTAEQEMARTDLQKLQMEPGKIDQYISKFEKLAK
jgi:hypothetical protein